MDKAASDFSGLAQRLSEATGPDRTLDRLIFDTVVHPGIEWRPYGPRARSKWGYVGDRTVAYGEDSIPHYCASLEEVIALVEAQAPDATCWSIERDRDMYDASISRNYVKHKDDAWCSQEMGLTAPIALLRALVKALQAHTEKQTKS